MLFMFCLFAGEGEQPFGYQPSYKFALEQMQDAGKMDVPVLQDDLNAVWSCQSGQQPTPETILKAAQDAYTSYTGGNVWPY